MSATIFYRWGLRLAGLLLLAIGTAHIFLPTHGYTPETVSGWNPETSDHFYYLATYMIGALLLTLSILSLIYSNQRPSRPIAWFATISTVLWILRLFLELKFPVTLKLYFLEQPHNILMIAIGIIIASYAMASGVAWGMLLIKK